MLIVGCIPIAVFFPTSSGLDQKYAVAVAVLHPGYIVGILSLWQDCDYRATTHTRNKIAANNFLDHDLILFRIYSASSGVLEGDDGLLSGWN